MWESFFDCCRYLLPLLISKDLNMLNGMFKKGRKRVRNWKNERMRSGQVPLYASQLNSFHPASSVYTCQNGLYSTSIFHRWSIFKHIFYGAFETEFRELAVRSLCCMRQRDKETIIMLLSLSKQQQKSNITTVVLCPVCIFTLFF